MDLVDRKIQAYTEEISAPEDEILSVINRETHLYHLNPRMLSGHLQGQILTFLARMIKPKYILELGTFTGYSAICLAKGLAPSGKMITLEVNPELKGTIEKNITRANLADRITPVQGNALDLIPGLADGMDLVFIDADKLNYPHYYEHILPKMASGGFIIFDNVLWSGKVLLSENEKGFDEETKVLKELNENIRQDPRVTQLLMPIRDGLLIVEKL